MSAIPVKIINADKYYNRGKSNQLHVMDCINLELPEAGMVAIFGRSGCGKTTLLNAVGGLDRIASGSIELFGQNIREDTDTLRNKYVGYIFQNYNLNTSETVFENVSAALRLCGMEDEREITERTVAALANVGMDKYRDRTPDTLSGGQQQRVAIARALVKNPAIILADEPTGNLDDQNTVMVMDILKQLSKTRLVLLVTHEAHLVDHYCDRVIEIVDGHIQSERYNENANGYIRRNKNHIYLGELPKQETAAPGVKLEYYGEPQGEINLKVVSVGGKLYLKSDNPAVKILDEGSEVQLVEGVFHDTPAEEKADGGRTLDMSRFAPFEGKHFGRLFHWKNSLKYAWRENFHAKKKKKGKGILRACLVLLAVVLVFMTATFSAGIRSYTELKKNHDPSMFYIPLVQGMDYAAVERGMGEHGMDFKTMIGWSPVHDSLELNFRSSTFMTSEAVTLTLEARPLDIAHLPDTPVVAGTKELSAASDIVITTATAQKLLDTATVSYLSEPSDLIGMVTRESYYGMGEIHLRIVGVVESELSYVYMDGLTLAKYRMGDFWIPMTYASAVGMENEIRDGEILLTEDFGSGYRVGDTATIHGIPFTVSRIIKTRTDIGEYPAFYMETTGKDLITDPTRYAQEVLGEDTLTDPAYYAWLLEYHFEHFPAFMMQAIQNRPDKANVSFDEWAVAETGNVCSYVTLLGEDVNTVTAAYLYRLEYDTYPDSEELKMYMQSDEYQRASKKLFNRDGLYEMYDQFILKNSQDTGWKGDYYTVIVSDADYIRIANSAGLTDNLLNFATYTNWEYGDGSDYFSHHLMIHSTDPAATESYLTEVLGREAFLTPEDVFDSLYSEMRGSVIATVISLLTVLALMCLCVYFIMRSSFMSRVREVGILRAIGVTRRNLIFRFAVETGMLILLTLVVGYLVSSLFIASLSGAALFSHVFYFPLWMAVGLLGIITAVSMLFGILPAITLLRKTPSVILSKYDI